MRCLSNDKNSNYQQIIVLGVRKTVIGGVPLFLPNLQMQPSDPSIQPALLQVINKQEKVVKFGLYLKRNNK